MANAHGAAGVMISIGKQLIANRTELISIILPRVQNALPEAIHRVHFSYALMVLATLKVSCYSKKANTPCNFITCLGQAWASLTLVSCPDPSLRAKCGKRVWCSEQNFFVTRGRAIICIFVSSSNFCHFSVNRLLHIMIYKSSRKLWNVLGQLQTSYARQALFIANLVQNMIAYVTDI